MPILSYLHPDGTETLTLGEPDRVDGRVKLWRVDCFVVHRETVARVESLGLMRVGFTDLRYLSDWYVQASWPLSWLLKVYYAPFWWWLFYRIIVREILCRHLYLIAWPEPGYGFRWKKDFRPYLWYRALKGRFDG